MLCTIFTFTLYIFFDNLKETTNMIKCGSDYKNRIMFFRGSLVLKQHSRAGKTVNPLAISLKHIYKCFIQTCLCAICFYTVRTTELIYTQGSKVYHDYISFSLIFYLKLSFSNKIFIFECVTTYHPLDMIIKYFWTPNQSKIVRLWRLKNQITNWLTETLW